MKNPFQSPPPDDHPAVDVLFVLLPNSLVLDWAGPAEALRLANQALQRDGQTARFRLRFVGPQAQTTGSVGVSISVLEPLPESLAAPCWVVLVGSPDESIDLDNAASRAAAHWLRRHHDGIDLALHLVAQTMVVAQRCPAWAPTRSCGAPGTRSTAPEHRRGDCCLKPDRLPRLAATPAAHRATGPALTRRTRVRDHRAHQRSSRPQWARQSDRPRTRW